jgi:hypothetical protein
MPKTREGLYKARPLLRLKAKREGRCPTCGRHPVRKKKPYKKHATGQVVVKAVCPNGHGWEMPYYEPEPPQEKAEQKKEEK